MKRDRGAILGIVGGTLAIIFVLGCVGIIIIYFFVARAATENATLDSDSSAAKIPTTQRTSVATFLDDSSTPIPSTTKSASSNSPAPSGAGRCPKGCTSPPTGCVIKGTIYKGQKIYLVPTSKWYDRSPLEPSQGERWFCTEQEATANGWRKGP